MFIRFIGNGELMISRGAFLLITLFAPVLSAETCPQGLQRVYVVYMNGILTTPEEADEDRIRIENLLYAAIDTGDLDFDKRCLNTLPLYNPTIGPVIDLLESAGGLEIADSLLWKILTGLIDPTPGLLNTVQGRIVQYLVKEPDDALKNVVASTARAVLDSNHGLVFAGHSQGNIVLNRVYYDKLSLAYQLQMRVVAIATPDQRTPNNRHTTLEEDVFMASVPGRLSPNTSNGPCGNPFICHELSEKSYLNPKPLPPPGKTPSRPQIRQHLIMAVREARAAVANQPPTAGFTMTSIPLQPVPNGQTLNLTVAPGGSATVFFNGGSPMSSDPDGSVTGWQWTINGAQAANTATFSRAFTTGTYDVSLLVTDNAGAQSAAATGKIVVNSASTSTPSDAVSDFSTVSNPNGPWSYGYTDRVTGGFNLHSRLQIDFVPGVDSWTSVFPNPFFVMVARNKTGSPIAGGTFRYPADMLCMNAFAPALYSTLPIQYNIVRWTAPNSGTFSIQGRFVALGSAVSVSDADVHVRHNGIELLGSVVLLDRSAQITSREIPFAMTRKLNAGDTIDFSVGVGPSGAPYEDPIGLSATISPSVGTPPLFTIRDLGTLGGTESAGLGLNNLGHVTGYSKIAGDQNMHAFKWDGSIMQDLGTLGDYSIGLAINDSDQIAGVSSGRAFYWNGTTMQGLDSLSGWSSGQDINAAGLIVGYSDAWDRRHAVVWRNGPIIQDLGTFGTSASIANGINSAGQITGSYGEKAVLWDGSSMRELGGLALTGRSINDRMQITGDSGTGHAFIWDQGVMKDIGLQVDSAVYDLSSGNDINNAGQVTGYTRGYECTGLDSSYCARAFYYDGNRMWDLNGQLVDASGWRRLSVGTRINESRQISGYGVTAAGKLHAFLLNPVATQ